MSTPSFTPGDIVGTFLVGLIIGTMATLFISDAWTEDDCLWKNMTNVGGRPYVCAPYFEEEESEDDLLLRSDVLRGMPGELRL